MNDLKFTFRQLLKNPGFTAVAIVPAVVVLSACWLPARRAAEVDPMVELRDE